MTVQGWRDTNGGSISFLDPSSALVRLRFTLAVFHDPVYLFFSVRLSISDLTFHGLFLALSSQLRPGLSFFMTCTGRGRSPIDFVLNIHPSIHVVLHV